MARIARAVAIGVPHHVTQRGNNRRDVFFDEQDYTLYLALLREFSVRHHLRIRGYRLMSNHVHLVAVPDAPDAMARTFARAHAEYARHVNIRARTSGHFWQSRYDSCPLDQSYRWNALAYVERNPVRAGVVAEADAYRWSSARARLEGSDERGLCWICASGVAYIRASAGAAGAGFSERRWRRRRFWKESGRRRGQGARSAPRRSWRIWSGTWGGSCRRASRAGREGSGRGGRLERS